MDLAWLLIEHSDDAATQSQEGTTPMDLTSLWGDVDVARLLLEHGANAAAQRKDGTAPPPLAFRSRVSLGLARLLRRHGSANATAQSWDTA